MLAVRDNITSKLISMHLETAVVSVLSISPFCLYMSLTITSQNPTGIFINSILL